MGAFAAEPPKARMPAFRLRSLGDDRLGRLVAAGDPRAFALVYERHHQALYRYCRSIVGDPEDAADALQNTMAAALRGLTGERRDIRLKPWLFRIAHNECISMLRGRRSHVVIDESLELMAPEGVDAFTRERLRQLVADLQELPEAQRSALVMRELSGLAYEDIAVALGGNTASARQSVFEARTALHELAEGRAMQCESVRRALSDNDGRVLRGRKLRAHMRACGSCQDFRELIGSRRRDLAMIAPTIPAAVAAGVLHHLVGGGAATATGGGAGAGGAGLGSLAAGKAVVASTAMKAAAIVAATAAVGAGTVETVRQVEHSSTSAPTAAPIRHPATVSHTPKTALKHASASGPATTHTQHSAVKKHDSSAKTTPANAHSHSGQTHTNHAGGNSNGAGNSDEHKTAATPAHPEHPQHPTTPTGKDDTPAQGKGAPATKGPPATTPGPQNDKAATPAVPVLPGQAQNGMDRSSPDHGLSDLSKGAGPGLIKH